MFVKQFDAQNGVMNEAGVFSTDYLSAAENDRVRRGELALLKRLSAKGH